MADETTDVANKEKLVIWIFWIDGNLQPSEDVIGLYEIENIFSNMLVSVMKVSYFGAPISYPWCFSS